MGGSLRTTFTTTPSLPHRGGGGTTSAPRRAVLRGALCGPPSRLPPTTSDVAPTERNLPMAPKRRVDPERQRLKRELRSEMARRRASLERSARAVLQETHSLVSWRTYARRYPTAAALGAASLGFTLAQVLRRSKGSALRGRSWLGRLLGFAARRAVRCCLDDLLRPARPSEGPRRSSSTPEQAEA